MSERIVRDLLHQRSGRVCERCRQRRATNAHHRRAAGRRWNVWNLLDLCGSGTTGCHGFVTNDEVALAKLYGWVVKRETDPLWIPALVGYRWCYLTRDGLAVPVRNTADLPSIADAFPDIPGLVRHGRR